MVWYVEHPWPVLLMHKTLHNPAISSVPYLM